MIYILYCYQCHFFSYHYIIDANYERNEAVNFVAIINDTQYLGQEYLVSFSKGSKYSELFMFDSDNTIIQKKSSDVFGSEATNFRGSVTKCILDDKIYYVFSFMTTEASRSCKGETVLRGRSADFCCGFLLLPLNEVSPLQIQEVTAVFCRERRPRRSTA